MSAYQQPTNNNATFCNSVFKAKDAGDGILNVKSLLANKIISTNTDVTNLEANTITLTGNTGIVNTGSGAFGGFQGITWIMDLLASNATVPSGFATRYDNAYYDTDIVGVTVQTGVDAVKAGCRILGTGAGSEGISQYNLTNGKWTCLVKGKYLIQSNIYVEEKASRFAEPYLRHSRPDGNGGFIDTNYTLMGSATMNTEFLDERQISNTQIINLEANDTLHIYIFARFGSHIVLSYESPTNSIASLTQWTITRIIG
jgi:hypothetical protein